MLCMTCESRGTSRNLGIMQKSGLPRRSIASSSAVLGRESCWASHMVLRADQLCAGLWELTGLCAGPLGEGGRGGGGLGACEPGCLASHRALADTGPVCWTFYGALGAHGSGYQASQGTIFLSLMCIGICSRPRYIAKSLLKS